MKINLPERRCVVVVDSSGDACNPMIMRIQHGLRGLPGLEILPFNEWQDCAQFLQANRERLLAVVAYDSKDWVKDLAQIAINHGTPFLVNDGHVEFPSEATNVIPLRPIKHVLPSLDFKKITNQIAALYRSLIQTENPPTDPGDGAPLPVGLAA